MKKGKPGDLSMMLKNKNGSGSRLYFFKYVPPIPQKDLKSQGMTIVYQPGMNLAPDFVLPGHSKEKIGK